MKVERERAHKRKEGGGMNGTAMSLKAAKSKTVGGGWGGGGWMDGWVVWGDDDGCEGGDSSTRLLSVAAFVGAVSS